MVGITPTHFAVIFDYSSQTFRNQIYPEYKANRSAPPEDLIPQFGLIRQATKAFNLPCLEKEGYEADDLIATYARLAEEAGARSPSFPPTRISCSSSSQTCRCTTP